MRTWVVYYAAAPEAAVDLACFDVVVLDPHAPPAASPRQAVCLLLLTYVSLGEVEHSQSEFAAVAGESWVLSANSALARGAPPDVRAPAYERWLPDCGAGRAGRSGERSLPRHRGHRARPRKQTDPAVAAACALERVLVEPGAPPPAGAPDDQRRLPLAERLPTVLDAVALESIWTDYDFKAKAYRVRPADEAESRALLLARVVALPTRVHHRATPRPTAARPGRPELDPSRPRPRIRPVRLSTIGSRPGLDPHPRAVTVP